jgi:hypothetical protein
VDGAKDAGVIVGPHNDAIDILLVQKLAMVVVDSPGCLPFRSGIFGPLRKQSATATISASSGN